MEKGRLFGAAVADVGGGGIRTVSGDKGRMRSDAGPTRTVVKLGARQGNRRVLAVSNPDGDYGSTRRLRTTQRDAPYTPVTAARRVVHRESPNASSAWQHDLFEGAAAAPGSQVFLRNLHPSVTKDDITKLFSQVGVIISVKIDPGPLTTARVSFVRAASAESAVQKLHGSKLLGRPMKVCEMPTSEQAAAAHRVLDLTAVAKRKAKGKDVLMSDAPHRSVFERLG